MNPVIQEWIDKAEDDFITAQREARARHRPNYDDACFHAQQCVEKYLKAILTGRNIPFPKTHDLGKLLDLTVPSDPSWEMLRPIMEPLSAYATEFRYPGDSADKATATEAISVCRQARNKARTVLGLSVRGR